MNDIGSYGARIGEVWWLAAVITVVVVGLLSIVFCFRGWLAEVAAASRFLLASLVFHVLLVMLLAAWSLPNVVDVIVSKLYAAEAAAQPFDNNQHQSHEDGREAWEKLADLKALQTSVDVVRRETEPLNIPNESQRLLPTMSLEMARLLPSDRLLYTPSDEPAERRQESRMSARTMVPPATAIDVADTAETVVPQTEEARVEATLVSREALARSPAETRVPWIDQELLFKPDLLRPQEKEFPPRVEQPQLAVTQTRPAALQRRASPAQPVEEITADGQDNILPAPGTALPGFLREPVALPRAASAAVQPDPVAPSRIPPPRVVETPPDPARPDLVDAAPTAVAAVSRLRSNPSLAMPLDDTPSITAQPAEPAGSGQLPQPNRTTELTRSNVPPPVVPAGTREIAGPSRPQRRLSVGELGGVITEAPPAFAPVVSRLERPRARASRVVFAEDNVGMQEMFTLRQGDIRKQYIELFGGTPESETAVNHGLEWLSLHQNADGSWSLNNFHENCKGKHANCSGAGNLPSNTAATGLALLPFLAAGHTHQAGGYQPQVTRAIKWLTDHQKENGDLLAAGDQQRMYSHSIAAIALCEAYGMTRDPPLEPAVRKALDFIVKAQHAGTGGWRYEPNQPGDTSVVGWAIMALKSGEMGGIAVPQATFDNVERWFQSVEGGKPQGGTFGYQNASGSPAMTAEGLLCLQFMGADRDAPRMRVGADYLLRNLPQPDQALTSYYWYYGTQVMYHMQGQYWNAWNAKLRDHLVASQIKDGPLAGTWDPKDMWEQRGGRVYATSLKLLMLEVYYRHLPLYNQLGE